MGKLLPDVHRELYRLTVLGNEVAVELSIQGTFQGPLETPAGIIQPTGAKIDVPTADFWYLRDGKVQTFNCYVDTASCSPRWARCPTSRGRSLSPRRRAEMSAQLADRLAIRSLVDAYARCADRRDAEGQKALFTEETHFLVFMDGEGTKPSQELNGREALTPVFAGLNRYEATTHFNGQSTIELHGDRATGETTASPTTYTLTAACASSWSRRSDIRTRSQSGTALGSSLSAGSTSTGPRPERRSLAPKCDSRSSPLSDGALEICSSV